MVMVRLERAFGVYIATNMKYTTELVRHCLALLLVHMGPYGDK